MRNQLACAAVVALLFVSTAHAGDYSIRSLAKYGDGITWSHLNNAGDVAGAKDLTLYVRGSTNFTHVTDNFYTSYVRPTVLANDGTLYANAVYYGSGSSAYGVMPDGTAVQLPRLPQTGSYAGRGSDYVHGVNDHGVAVGSGNNGSGYTNDHGEYFNGYDRAVLYRNGQIVDLGTFGAQEAYAAGINNHGAIVGSVTREVGRADAYIYVDGKMTILRERSNALRINDAGMIAGVTHNVDSQWNRWDTAFIYQNGAFTDLTLEGYEHTRILDLNNAGQVLGYADGYPREDYFLYENGKTTFLSELLARQEGSAGWRLSRGMDINDRGEILVEVLKNDGQTYSQKDYWVLTPGIAPVPEPSTWAMLLAGLGAVGALARRKVRQA